MGAQSNRSYPKLTITQFRHRFPDDDSCLDYLYQLQYAKIGGCTECGGMESFKRIKGKRSYYCPLCHYQLYPTAGTVFHKTTTPLTYWFYAIYLFTTTRNGVAAKELERQLNICYKTALRMAHQIKILMADRSDELLTGEVIADETYIGQKREFMHKEKVAKLLDGTGAINKIAVFGLMQKDGRIITKVMKPWDVKGYNLKPLIQQHVDPNSLLITDGHGAYHGLHLVFKQHEVINHEKGEYKRDRYTTNAIENYWSTLKRMIKGTHIHVSEKHLPKYIAENSFRYTHREQPEKMFDIILSRII